MVLYKMNELYDAIERDEIVPCFQPLLKLRTGELTGFEVLSRWRHPVHGMISPDQFIPLAKESGIIGLLTEKRLRQAIAAASAIPCALSLSVNISSTQFRDLELRLQIERAAKRSNFLLRRQILKITEGALIDNLQEARAISHGLKELGIRLALDGFGAGYSSLRHL